MVIICASLGSTKILENIGHKIEMEGVIGQAIEVQINNTDWKNWPAVINTHKCNLIPNGKNKLIIGATLETNISPSILEMEQMKRIYGFAPKWIQESSIKLKWHGIRARPLNRSAPILEKLESGLIVATGHYRNGILLAPATAEWVLENIQEN